jgi:hypothetical protein
LAESSGLELALLKLLTEVVMPESLENQAHLCWCQVPVPEELVAERLCVVHFILGVEHDCADLRRETALGRTSPARQAEIASYVKATAMKLTEVATSRHRLTDELKKRILTTFLTLMNVQESLDRSANRSMGPIRTPVIVAGLTNA